MNKGDPFSRGFPVIDDYVFNVLSWKNSEVQIPGSFYSRHVLGVLRIPFEWLRDTIPLDKLFNRHRSSEMALDGVLKTVEYGVRRSSRVEPFETLLLDVFDERRG
ncbi:hypothetical protein C472_15167 [Halorubrum tebenquichense DSM 14210]|uniref:Uncharacterized protein n=1 Tax=Halorubrum tebenquichense DSM 14210 TaxID=1227485 RepID=M0DCQ0_9EURY|nr:hypothetical protein C472_15167 [Halorubrum tebenquichense DSM 14210]